MDKQHPIPQQISTYQFRLVGDMTLTQFFQVGGGAMVSLLIYATNLHPYIKWPLILFSFGVGAALAFLPLEDRPLAIWILSFFRSVYSPTIYYWKGAKVRYRFYQEEVAVSKDVSPTTPHGEVVLEDYLKIRPDQKSDFLSRLEEGERSFLAGIKKLYQPTTKTPPEAPSSSPFKDALPKNVPVPAKVVQAPTPKPQPKAPTVKPVSIASKGFRPKIVVEEKPVRGVSLKPKVATHPVSPTVTGSQPSQAQSAQFSVNAAPPMPPIIPNTIVGQVMDPEGKIIEGAILEIRDLAGRPVRALRSNKVGHFMIVTSLADGQYDILTEKEGFEFDPIVFKVEGKNIPPVAIRAKRRVEIIPELSQNSSLTQTIN